MDRWEQHQNNFKGECRVNSCFGNYDGIERWLEQEESPAKHPNIYTNLSNNLNKYENAYKKLSSFLSQEEKAKKCQNFNNCFTLNRPHRAKALSSKNYRRKHMTTQIDKSRTNGIRNTSCKKKDSSCLETEQSIFKKTMNKQNCMENLQIFGNLDSLQITSSKSKGMMLQSLNMNIQHLKFDKQIQGMPKKRDRYKQIFGEKPKFVLIKRSSDNSHNKSGLLCPKFR